MALSPQVNPRFFLRLRMLMRRISMRSGSSSMAWASSSSRAKPFSIFFSICLTSFQRRTFTLYAKGRTREGAAHPPIMVQLRLVDQRAQIVVRKEPPPREMLLRREISDANL